MLSIPSPILQESGRRKEGRGILFVVVFMATTAALTLLVNIIPMTGDFYNTVGYLGVLLPIFSVWLTVGLPQPLSLFMPSRLFAKYMSSCALMLFSFALSFVFPAVLMLFGEISVRHILGAYLGLSLLGLSYMSLGVCLRLMIGSSSALGIMSFVFSVCLYFTAFEPRFYGFVKGLPSLGGILFFVSFSIFFVIVAALIMFGQRRSAVMQKTILTGLALVLLNIFAVRAQLYADLTHDRIFSLSDETLVVLDSLDYPVEVLAAFPPGSTTPYFDISREILRAYGRHPNVNVSFAPSRRLRYEFSDIAPGSVIAIGGNGDSHGHGGDIKVIPPEKLFISGFNEDELRMYVSALNIEAELTNAILYCTACENPVLAQVIGNSETPMPQGFVEALISANYDVEHVLITEDDIPPEVSVLLIKTPAIDWSEQEIAKLARFLDGGGSAMFALDAGIRQPSRLTGVLSELGIEMGDRLVSETQDYLHMGINVIAATRPFASGGRSRRVLMPNSRAVYQREDITRDVDVKGLITTSPFAFEKSHPWETDTDEQLDTFALAARVEVAGLSPYGTRVVVLGSSNIFDETANELSSGENYRFLIDAINWTQGIEKIPDIPPITLTTPRLNSNFFMRLST